MHSSELSFVPLLVVIALSFLVPVALAPVRRLGIPAIVGEIIAGMIVGRSGLGLVQEDFVLEVLSVFGFAYLMFLSGLEIDFSMVPRRTGLRGGSSLNRFLRNPFTVGGIMFALTGVFSVSAGFYLAHLHLVENPWIMALILSTTSLGVVAPVLKERGMITTRLGQTIMICALIADFVTIFLISIWVLLRSQGLTVDLLTVLVLLLAAFAAYRLVAVFREHPPAQRLMRALSTATSQIRVRGSLAVALVFIALAESLGIESIVGAFLAGAIISLISGSGSSMLRDKLDAIGYGFFIPIFFIMVGVKFDLPALVASGSAWRLVLLLVGIAYGVKLLGGLVFKLNYSWRDTLAASTLLSARLSLIIAVATIGLEIGAISPAVDAAIILVAIITCIVSPVLFLRLLPYRHRSREYILVVGSNQDAETLAQRLQRLERDAVAITDIAGSERPADEEAGPPPQGLLEKLRQADIAHAQAVVALTDSDTDNLHICRIAREVHGIRNIVAWVQDPALNKRFMDLGARVANPAYSKQLILEGMVLSAGAFASTPEADPNQDIRVIKLQNQWLRDRRLRHMGLPEGVHVLRIERGGAVLVPGLDTEVRANDTFTVTGDKKQVDQLARRFARRW